MDTVIADRLRYFVYFRIGLVVGPLSVGCSTVASVKLGAAMVVKRHFFALIIVKRAKFTAGKPYY